MDKQAKMNQSQVADQILRDEVIRLAEEVRKLRREKDYEITQKIAAEAKVTRLTQTLEALQKERDQDKDIIAYLSAKPQATEVRKPRRDGASVAPPREASEVTRSGDARRMTPLPTPATLEHLHDNPKFPDAPVF